MSRAIKKIIILGGGSAGWLTAGVIAAEHQSHLENGVQVTLVESPEIGTIGVGEGTWPSMRNTLRKMGVSETELFKECEASFKQGAKFAKWVTGKPDDFYYHPLVVPQGYTEVDLALQWQPMRDKISFADAVSFQGHLCEYGSAPKLITTPEYVAVANYAYHLNSVKLGHFLQRHCTEKLGVKHVLDKVIGINSEDNGDIASLVAMENGNLEADLFIDCSGFASALLGKHYGIPFVDRKHVLFNDSALAVQVPYDELDSPIASHTISTAQSAGWIWDIGLPTRRGVGNVYSSAHISDEAAAKELVKYIESTSGIKDADQLSMKKISIKPGHREIFWYKNCVAVGMAAGFIEPLEASALVLVELSAAMISEELPASRDVMDTVSKRFNTRFRYRWDSIVDFLKLHYILTKRTDSEYWIDNCREETIPDRLLELMSLWRYQPPNRHDFPQVEEVFASASWQYVLYGMGFETIPRATTKRSGDTDFFNKCLMENQKLTAKCLASLPKNRELIDKIHRHGFQKV